MSELVEAIEILRRDAQLCSDAINSANGFTNRAYKVEEDSRWIAADRIEELQAENERLRHKLDLILNPDKNESTLTLEGKDSE